MFKYNSSSSFINLFLSWHSLSWYKGTTIHPPKCSSQQKKQESSLAPSPHPIDLQVLSIMLQICSTFCIPITTLLTQTMAMSHPDCGKTAYCCPYTLLIFLQSRNSMDSNVRKMWQIVHFIYPSEYPKHFHLIQNICIDSVVVLTLKKDSPRIFISRKILKY